MENTSENSGIIQPKRRGGAGGARAGAGRPKGKRARSTIEANALKQLYVDLAREHGYEIAAAVIKKAKKGDMAAVREFNDRAYGKAPQAVQHSGEIVSKVISLDE